MREGGRGSAAAAGNLNGIPALPPDAAPPTAAPIAWRVIGRRLKASPQQILIARLIVEQDLTAQEIGRTLGITAGSVEKQIERLYAKLNQKPPRGSALPHQSRIRSRAALVNRIWVEYWRMREEEASTV